MVEIDHRDTRIAGIAVGDILTAIGGGGVVIVIGGEEGVVGHVARRGTRITVGGGGQ
tara:strand:- start:320 stop:490 length:171 start_codon:yes stop_codon:yes gene_type:complete